MDKTKDIRIYALKQLEQIKDSRSEFIEHLKECGLDEEEYKHEYLNYYYKRLN